MDSTGRQDFDLIELNAGQRWPAMEWVASKGSELLAIGGIQVLDGGPFQFESFWFSVIILNLSGADFFFLPFLLDTSIPSAYIF